MNQPTDDSKRRRFTRVPVSMLIQYRFDNLEDFLSEYSVDMSLGGMFIRTDDIRDEGSLVYIQFYLRDGAKLIEGLAKVVWVNRADPTQGNKLPPGMGIEFVNFDEESMALINQIVDRNLSRHQPEE